MKYLAISDYVSLLIGSFGISVFDTISHSILLDEVYSIQVDKYIIMMGEQLDDRLHSKGYSK